MCNLCGEKKKEFKEKRGKSPFSSFSVFSSCGVETTKL